MVFLMLSVNPSIFLAKSVPKTLSRPEAIELASDPTNPRTTFSIIVNSWMPSLPNTMGNWMKTRFTAPTNNLNTDNPRSFIDWLIEAWSPVNRFVKTVHTEPKTSKAPARAFLRELPNPVPNAELMLLKSVSTTLASTFAIVVCRSSGNKPNVRASINPVVPAAMTAEDRSRVDVTSLVYLATPLPTAAAAATNAAGPANFETPFINPSPAVDLASDAPAFWMTVFVKLGITFFSIVVPNAPRMPRPNAGPNSIAARAPSTGFAIVAISFWCFFMNWTNNRPIVLTSDSKAGASTVHACFKASTNGVMTS